MILMTIFLKNGRVIIDEFCSYENASMTLLNYYILECDLDNDIKEVIIQ